MVTTFDDHDVREAVALEEAKAATVGEAISDEEKSETFYHYMDTTKVPMASTVDGAGNRIEGIEDFLTDAQYWPNTPHHEKVVEDILRRFPVLSHGNKFHAILPTSSIPEAIDYYRSFKECASQMKVTALFDPNVDNNAGSTVKEDALIELIEDYNKAYGQEFTIPTWPAMKKDISARLSHKKPYVNVDSNRDSRIDLLIVVNQMLTGFDSKWLNTLYLDKTIKYEDIIQAFSRTNRLFGPDKPFGTIRYYRRPHTMQSHIEAAVKLYSGDRPLDMFVQKLPDNIALMDARLQEILMVFDAAHVGDLSKLPESQEARRKFAKEFVELNEFLEAAKVQGFTWEQDTYEFKKEPKEGAQHSESIFVQPIIDERTYLTLVQRYKELFASRSDASDSAPDAPYELDGHITEIDTGLIDSDYMNSNFEKWLKCLEQDDEGLAAAREELHRSFASLSQDDQRFAELFLHDVERGDATLKEGMTLRDYITSYAHKAKNAQIERVVEALGINGELLTAMTALDLTEANINEFGRFDSLKDSVDKSRAKAFFEQKEGKSLPLFKVNTRAAALLKRFILEGGFDINE